MSVVPRIAQLSFNDSIGRTHSSRSSIFYKILIQLHLKRLEKVGENRNTCRTTYYSLTVPDIIHTYSYRLYWFHGYILEFRIFFFGTQVSKTQVRLENIAGTRLFFNPSPR